MRKFSRKFRRVLSHIKKLLVLEEYSILMNFILNFLKINREILKNPELEFKAQAKRGYVYSVDFGFNIGSELRDRHYCVVLSAKGKVANVIPFTSKNPKSSTIPRTELGIIPKLSTKKVSYALVNQITTVSKARLMTPRIKGKLLNIKLTAEQLNKIEEELSRLLFKKD